MKAGIYRDTLGNLFSVRKDRTVAAFKKTTMRDVHPMERTVYVSSRREDQAIVCSNLFEGEALRWADLPSGCQNHVTALALAIKANNEKNAEALGLTGCEWPDCGRDGNHNGGHPGCCKTETITGRRPSEPQIQRFPVSVGSMSSSAPGVSNLPRTVDALNGLTAATKEGTVALKEFGGTFSAVLPGYRVCHAQSARKHRKQGHHVIPIGVGKYAWAVSP